MKIDLAREIALKIIYKIEEEKAYSNIILDEYLNQNRQKLSVKDVNFITELVYSVVSNKIAIDTIIQKYSKIKINKISKWVLNILRLGVNQIIFLDKVPKSAAVNESVNLCKKYGYKSSSFVNAILRKVSKEDYEELLKIKDPLEKLSLYYSMPKWLVQKLLEQYNFNIVEDICKFSNEKTVTSIRINTLKTNKNEVKNQLDEMNIEYIESNSENFLHLKGVKEISKLDIFKKGLITVQDVGAGKISEIVDPKQNEIILDACSAPGGKTTYLAQIMQNNGEIYAWDLHEHRIKLVEETAQRLGISIIKTQLHDATIYNKKYENKFDKILLDVPCLGIGVIKRKPDIKWQKNEKDIDEITTIQERILECCYKYLKHGGELVYSTCSLLKEENEDIIDSFIEKQKTNGKKIKKIYEEKILPTKLNDGFFICKIVKEL